MSYERTEPDVDLHSILYLYSMELFVSDQMALESQAKLQSLMKSLERKWCSSWFVYWCMAPHSSYHCHPSNPSSTFNNNDNNNNNNNKSICGWDSYCGVHDLVMLYVHKTKKQKTTEIRMYLNYSVVAWFSDKMLQIAVCNKSLSSKLSSTLHCKIPDSKSLTLMHCSEGSRRRMWRCSASHGRNCIGWLIMELH